MATSSSATPPRRPVPVWRSGRLWRKLSPALVLFALANAVYSAWDQGWTYDEPFHLTWTERLLTTGNASRDSQHFNSKTPVMLPNVLARMAAARAGGTEPVQRFAARLPTVGWLAALFAAVFLLARRLFGTVAAHLATAATALDANLVAHGSLATVDVVYTLATLLTVAAAVSFAARPSMPRACGLGLALGLALTAKFSAVLLLPSLLLLPLLARPPRREWPRWVAAALVVSALSAATICAAYLFHGVGRPIGAHWASSALSRVGHAWPGLRLPLPRGFLTGIDASLAAERGDWNVVLLGRSYPRGTWFYFLVLWALKTPVLLLLAEIWGLSRAARSRFGLTTPAVRFLGIVLLVHLGYFSFVFRTQVGYRFVLMCLPLLMLLAAAGVAPLAARPWAPAAAAALVAIGVAENAVFFGNPLAFSNAAVWPKRDVFRLMADSNLDWGQNDERIERWLSLHRRDAIHYNPAHLLPGRNLFDVNEAAGVGDFEKHRFLRENVEPTAHVRHTHLWFDVDEGLFGRFLEAQRRLAPPADPDALCDDGGPSTVVPASGTVNASLPSSPSTALRIACIRAPDGADVGLLGLSGHARLGIYRRAEACTGEAIAAGQQLWRRLEPGVHALCLASGADAAAAAQPFEGWWRVARHDVFLRMVEPPRDGDASGQMRFDPPGRTR